MYCYRIGVLRKSVLKTQSPKFTFQKHRNLNVLIDVPQSNFQLESLDQIPLEEISVAKTKIQSKQYKQAEPPLQRALDIIKSSLGDANPLSIAITNQLLSLSLSLHNYSSAEKLALQLLQHTKADDYTKKTTLLKQLVYCYYIQGKTDEALGFCDEFIYEARNKKDTQSVSEGLLTMGNIYLLKKQLDLAQKFYEQSVKNIDTSSQKSSTTVDKVKALNNIGFVLQWKNLTEPAIKFYELAILSINQAEEQKLEVASHLQQCKAHILTNMGEAQFKVKQLKEAEESLEKATKIYNSDEKTDPLALAACLHRVANVYQAKKANILTEGIYNKTIDLYEQNEEVLPESGLLIYQNSNLYRDFAGFLRDIKRTTQSKYDEKATLFDSRFEHKP